MKRILILLVVLTGVGFFVASTTGIVAPGPRREPSAARVEAPATPPDATPVAAARETCPSADEIPAALRGLASGEREQVARAQAMLRDKAAETPACRREVIAALVTAVDLPQSEIKRDDGARYTWQYGALLLGELQAIEALDLLVSQLTMETGVYYSLSMSHRPALRAVIEMGPVAIPKLDAVLRQHEDRWMRYSAAWCIATIGSPEAVASLRQASDAEADPCVGNIIRVSLDNFDDNGRITNRMRWGGGLVCG